jgi:hypothetical protein
MLEFPLIQKLIAETKHKAIIDVLKVRFGEVPQELVSKLGRIRKENRLDDLHRYAVMCPDLKAFQTRLKS